MSSDATQENRPPPKFELPVGFLCELPATVTPGKRVPVQFLGERTYGDHIILHEATGLAEPDEGDEDYAAYDVRDESITGGVPTVLDPSLEPCGEPGELLRVRTLAILQPDGKSFVPAMATATEPLNQEQANAFRERQRAQRDEEFAKSEWGQRQAERREREEWRAIQRNWDRATPEIKRQFLEALEPKDRATAESLGMRMPPAPQPEPVSPHSAAPIATRFGDSKFLGVVRAMTDE